MKWWSLLLDWCEGRLINNILANRFLHPQLRALILIGTETAERTIAALRTVAQNTKYVGKQIKSLIDRAGLILRFRKEEIPVLLAMLESETDREYALDRLGQLREPQAINPLLAIIREQNNKFARNAVSSVCLVASGSERPDYSRIVAELRRILDDVQQSHLKRLSIYDGLLSLGETGIRQPGLLDACLFQLRRIPVGWVLGSIALALLLLLSYRISR
jgi:hypothetical protein